MSDTPDTTPKAEDQPEATKDSPWIAAVPLRWGVTDTGEPNWVQPGQPVPADEPGRNYELLRRTGQIIHKDGAAGIAPYMGAAFVLHDSDHHLSAPIAAEAETVAVDLGNGGDGAGSGDGENPAASPSPRFTLSESMTLAELGAIADSLKLPTSGSKAQLIARITKAQDAAEAAATEAPKTMTDPVPGVPEGQDGDPGAAGTTPPADATTPAGDPSSAATDPTNGGNGGA